MSFLRRAPALKLDRNRVELGAAISLTASTGINPASGNANVFILTAGTMNGTIYKSSAGGGTSGTFTGRQWKFNNLNASNYYVKANNINALGGSVSPAQSSGTLGNWTQVTTNLNWGIAVDSSDESTDFQLHISTSSSGTPLLDTVNVNMQLFYTGDSGGGGGTK